MLPTSYKSFISPDFWNNQYPKTDDCVVLDKQIAEIEKDILALSKLKISTNIKDFSVFGVKDFTSYINAKKGVDSAYSLLKKIQIEKKNLVALADCRNQIETIRQEETAQVFTDASAKAETRVLTDTKNKQYLLIGVGAVAVLTVVYLVTRKK